MGARFYKADLKEADFTGADLTGASLEGAALDGAILKNAILQNAYATEVRCDQYRFVFVCVRGPRVVRRWTGIIVITSF